MVIIDECFILISEFYVSSHLKHILQHCIRIIMCFYVERKKMRVENKKSCVHITVIC